MNKEKCDLAVPGWQLSRARVRVARGLVGTMVEGGDLGVQNGQGDLASSRGGKEPESGRNRAGREHGSGVAERGTAGGQRGVFQTQNLDGRRSGT